ncbi:MAG: rod shape-determining protein MreD [Candidatus Omnitrophota bacterium]|nr:rod shape-determining protein MreD [Candidatus Omnitrophota bacterium]
MYKINRLRDYSMIMLAFFAQVFLSDFMSVAGAKPSFLIIMTVFFALFTDERFGFEAGFVCGMILDIFSLRLFGLNTILFSFAGYFIGRFNRKIYRESIITHAIMIFVTSFFILSLCRLFIGIQNKYLASYLSLGFVFSPVVFLSAAYNSFLGVFVYTLLNRILRLGETSIL